MTSIAEATGRDDWRVAIVLGSGLSPLAAALTGADPISYADVEAVPWRPGEVPGHAGALYAAEVEDTPTLVFAGRVHLYQGFTPWEVTAWVRASAAAGCGTVVVTNAAGGLDPTLEIGAPVLISDHLNLTGSNPLAGSARFLDLTAAYAPALRVRARAVDATLREGVYAGLTGPTYETPAEVRMLRALGADLVGMSTVHETIVARSLGLDVLGISVVTNLAAGISPQPLSHDEVAAAGRAAAGRMGALLRGVVAGL